MLLSPLDVSALAFFLFGWAAYHVLVERSRFGRKALNNRMNEYRLRWMLEMQAREARIVDASLLATLQSGTAFFASTSALALGGSLTLLRGADDALRILSDLPLGTAASRAVWDLKVVGLVVIFGYAFFKFAWSYRLFNYVAILVGGDPVAEVGASGPAPADRAEGGRDEHRGWPAFQPRAKGLLLRPRLSRLVHRSPSCSSSPRFAWFWRSWSASSPPTLSRP